MFWLIFLGIMTMAMLLLGGIAIGGVLFIPEDIRGSFKRSDILSIAAYVITTLMVGGLFCFTLSEYVASNVGYDSSEYQMEKKITTSGRDCKNEVDTVYFFSRKCQ